uniref:rRNA adenine N(6)-methyltransferase n=1 Tax=Leersia perrieri TaxID=77586 RepID=A0A0D9X6U5_9ORYZ
MPSSRSDLARATSPSSATVAAVEIDPQMSAHVSARASCLGLAHKLAVTTGDMMAVDFPDFDVCVSSISDGILLPLTAKLLFGDCCSLRPFRSTALVVQWQFALRLIGEPGNGEHSLLAANARLVADVWVVMDVDRTDFVPVPIVDSSLVEIVPRISRPKEFTEGVDVDVDEDIGLFFVVFQKRYLVETQKLSIK